MQIVASIAGTLNLKAASIATALEKALAALADKQTNSRPEAMLKLSHQCRYNSRNAFDVSVASRRHCLHLVSHFACIK